MRIPSSAVFVAPIIAAVAMMYGCSNPGGQVTGNVAHGQSVAKARCAACHGADGNSTLAIYPRLAGQRADYLYRQLSAFKDGSRPSTVMAPIATPLPDADLRDAAVFFARQARGSDAPGPQALMAQGGRLFQFGSEDRSVPACAGCHALGASGMGGMGGMGRMPMRGMMGMRGMTAQNAPTLYGQHAAYVVSQLQAFADGALPATVMNGISAPLTPQQRQAVADYVAAHP